MIGDHAWEMAGWVYLGGVGYQQVITKASDVRGLEWLLEFYNTTTKFRWAVRNTAGSAWVIATASVTGSISTWYFVDVYHDPSTDKIGISINNGAFATADLSGGGYASDTAKVCLSSNDNATPNTPFGGRIDELGIWRRLLTAAERTRLYNGGNGLSYPF